MILDIEYVLSCLIGITTIGGILFAAHRWVITQEQVRKKVKEQLDVQDKENQVLVYGLLACLDGLQQLGCNHNVTKAYAELQKHLNRRAHNDID